MAIFFGIFCFKKKILKKGAGLKIFLGPFRAKRGRLQKRTEKKINFEQLVKTMYESDLQYVKAELVDRISKGGKIEDDLIQEGNIKNLALYLSLLLPQRALASSVDFKQLAEMIHKNGLQYDKGEIK